MKKWNGLVWLLVFALQVSAADSLTETLQRGLLEEESNRDLNAAIRAYESVVQSADEQRKIVATALFRLGECYRKLGRTNDAHAQYQRILRDFSDQEALVALSQSLLPRDAAALTAHKTVMDPAAVELLHKEIALAEKQVLFEERKAAAGKSVLSFVLEAKRNVLRLKRLLPENASPEKQREVLREQIALVKATVDQWKRKVEVGTLAPGDEIPAQRELLGLERELAMISNAQGSDRPKSEVSSQSLQENIRELERRIAQVRAQNIAERIGEGRLKSMSQEDLLQSDAARNDARISALCSLKLEVEQKLAELKTQFGDEHADVKATQNRRKVVAAAIDDALAGLVKAAQMRAAASAAQLQELEKSLDAELKKDRSPVNRN